MKTKASQCNTEYHKLYEMIKSLEDYSEVSNKEEMKIIVKNLFNDYNKKRVAENTKGHHGIAYKTIHDDSSSSDSHTVFFTTESERNDVFDDWQHEFNFDDIFLESLTYRTPSPNLHDITKIYRDDNNIIYIAK